MLSVTERTAVARLEREAGALDKEAESARRYLILGSDVDHEVSRLQRGAMVLRNEAKGIRLNAIRRLFGLRPVQYEDGWWHWWIAGPFMATVLFGPFVWAWLYS